METIPENIRGPSLPPADNQASSTTVSVSERSDSESNNQPDADSTKPRAPQIEETPSGSSTSNNQPGTDSTKPRAPQIEETPSGSSTSDNEEDDNSEVVVDPNKPRAPQIGVSTEDPVVVTEEPIVSVPAGDPVTLRKGVIMEPVRELQRF